MTTQYDNTQHLDSLSIIELRKLKANIALTLVKKYGASNENMSLFKESITELAKSVGLGVSFLS